MLTHGFHAGDLLPESLRGTGLQMGHSEDAFTLRLAVILQGPEAVCVNMISVCVCVCMPARTFGDKLSHNVHTSVNTSTQRHTYHAD